CLLITCTDDGYVLVQLVLPNHAIQYELVSCGLHGWGSTIHLIQEDEPARVTIWYGISFNGESCHRRVSGSVSIESRKAHKVCRITLSQANIDHLQFELLSDLVNDLRLSHARTTHDHGNEACLDIGDNHWDCLTDLYFHGLFLSFIKTL